MTTTDKFNLKRFGAVLGQYFSSNKRQLIGGTIVILGLLTLIAFAIGSVMEDEATDFNTVGYYENSVAKYTETPYVELLTFSMCFGLFSMISASLTFSSFKSKKHRITSLMLPAAKSETFLSRVLIYTILGNIMFVICAIIADALRSALVYGPTIWTVISDNVDILDSKFILMFICNTLLNQSIFTLGAAMWPRNSFVKTFVALFVVMMSVLCVGALDIVDGIFDFLFDFSFSTHSAVSFAMSIVFYLLAWLRFKHTQVVQRFMMT